MNEIRELLPFIIPFAAIQFGLLIAALVHIFKSQSYRLGNRTVWVLICLFGGFVGVVVYFIIGRGESGGDE